MAHRILVVDDTPVVLDFLEFVFRRAGFEVLRAASGEAALAAAVEDQPDILLVDVLRPGMDGLEVCRQLRAMPSTARVPILLYSAVVREEIASAARAAGADEFLGKTMNHAELVDRVRDWLAVVARPGWGGAAGVGGGGAGCDGPAASRDGLDSG
ncbi:MAG: response regulator [Chloroflexota bacterium]